MRLQDWKKICCAKLVARFLGPCMLILSMAWVVLLGMLSFNSFEDHTKMGPSELGEGTLPLTSYISSHKFVIFFFHQAAQRQEVS